MNYKVQVNEKDGRKIQKLCFANGIYWLGVGQSHFPGVRFLFVYSSHISCTSDSDFFDEHESTLILPEDLIILLKEKLNKVTITIEGKDIEISRESVEAVRQALIGGEE